MFQPISVDFFHSPRTLFGCQQIKSTQKSPRKAKKKTKTTNKSTYLLGDDHDFATKMLV